MPVLKLRGERLHPEEVDQETIKLSLDNILRLNKNEILDKLNKFNFFKFNLTSLELNYYLKGSQCFEPQQGGQQEVFYIFTRKTLSEIILKG